MFEQFQRGGDGRHPGGEGEGRLAVLQVGDATLEGEPRGILAPAVIEALVDARRLLRVRAADGNRRHDGAGGRVGRLAGVDRPRAERRSPRRPGRMRTAHTMLHGNWGWVASTLDFNRPTAGAASS